MMGSRRTVPIPANRRASALARGRRGAALVYVTATLVALLAFASLAVDLGRVYVVRSELQLAADAAARHGAAGLSTDVPTAESYAVDAADDNMADGRPVVLDGAKDIEFGVWDASTRSFTVLTGSARAGANAIRVTARRTSANGNSVPLMFARVLGRTTCDVQVTSVARVGTTAGPDGFVGSSEIEIGNNALVAGYDSDRGAPGGANALDVGALGSNGEIEVGQNSTVRSGIKLGPRAQFGRSGWNVTRLSSPMSFPAIEAPPVASSGVLNVPTNKTLTLPGGAYSYSSVRLGNNATLSFSGTTTLYVSGDITFGNNGRLIANEDKPANLRVRVSGSGDIELGNGARVIAELYAPAAGFEAGNNAHIRGSLVARELELGNNAELFYDVRLAAGSGSSGIALVD